MTSILDIIQSVMIAGIVSLMVLGVHFMTMRTSNETMVVQHMQGVAQQTMAILQEEIKQIHSFTSDSLKVYSNTLYYRKLNDNIVLMEAHTDTLTIREVTVGSQLSFGLIHSVPSENSVVLTGTPTVSPGNLILLTSEMGEGQWKLIDSYNSASKTVTVRGEWDMIPYGAAEYSIYQTNQVAYRTYWLNLKDKSDQDIYAFNLVQLNQDGSEAPIGGGIVDARRDARNIHLLRVTVSIKSRQDQLYDGKDEQYVIDLQRDFFLRGYAGI